MIKGLNDLKKRPKPELLKLAKKAGIKASVGWNRTTLATKILEKQKLEELEESESPLELEPESEPGQSKRKPDFETLATEAPEIAPDLPQDEKVERGGYRPGSGRTAGLTDEKYRVRKILDNKVPDPVVLLVVESVFGLAGEPKKAVKPTPEMIAVPATNLISYYFPNLHISPVLEMWFDLLVGSKNLIVSQIEKRKAEPKPVIEQREKL